uniref:Uncharacterized immunity region protein 4 n=1 Tax=Bacillus phage phi105 TaxID=10717 RepID=YIM4_BPPH1|nr:RecName: Full=Uncharacterized immunity region protein 4 [Bacillus phage phi105]AAA88401.1 unknown protein [Bacillus phage phi105]prf//1112178J ORF 4 [Bacillus phage phi105]
MGQVEKARQGQFARPHHSDSQRRVRAWSRIQRRARSF